jgi:hypothetical protein
MVKLARSSGAQHNDLLWIDADRDGKFSEREKLSATPKETRGKWWSSFESELSIPVAAEERREGDATRVSRVAVVRRRSRRARREARVALVAARLARRPGADRRQTAWVLITEMEMDGMFDQRDSWALARDHEKLYAAKSRSLEDHAWLDGVAYRR